MKIQMVMSHGTSKGPARPGMIVDLPTREAEAFIESGKAIRVVKPRKAAEKPAKGSGAASTPEDGGDASSGD